MSVQKKGIYIPLLAEIYLNTLDLVLLAYLNALSLATSLVCTYVDNNLVCIMDELEITLVKEIAFRTSSALVFTTEEAIDNCLQ